MSPLRKHARLLTVGVSCAAIGGGAGAIASAGAGTPANGHPQAGMPGAGQPGAAEGGHGHGFRGLAMRAVTGTIVVRTSSGWGNMSFERGTVDSVNGQQLKLTEGTRDAAYKTVTLTIPSSARVRDDHQVSTLSAVKPGQRVVVVQAPHQTFVLAHTPGSSM